MLPSEDEKNGLRGRIACFFVSLHVFSAATNLARRRRLLLKGYCAGFGLKKSNTIG